MYFIRTCVFFVLNIVFVFSQLGSVCVTPNGDKGLCFPLKKCDQLLFSLTNSSPSKKKFIRESFCGDYNFSSTPVCCGLLGDYKNIDYASDLLNTLPLRLKIRELLPERKICGRQGIQDRIVGGNKTGIDEFPWMVMLEYRNALGNNEGHQCGGVLISSRYVLTAAHCVKEQSIQPKQLFRVRLGENDIRTPVDCYVEDGVRICADPAEDIYVEEIVAHADYAQNRSGTFNDIALARLSQPINFTDYIRPICLPLAKETSDVGTRLFVAGWGRTEQGYNSPEKLKVDLRIVDFNDCASRYSQHNFSLTSNQICALGDPGKDSCSGDSGGPLMRTFPNSVDWYVQGIVSFGPRLCGQTNIPGVYTSVADFIDWIVRNIKE